MVIINAVTLANTAQNLVGESMAVSIGRMQKRHSSLIFVYALFCQIHYICLWVRLLPASSLCQLFCWVRDLLHEDQLLLVSTLYPNTPGYIFFVATVYLVGLLYKSEGILYCFKRRDRSAWVKGVWGGFLFRRCFLFKVGFPFGGLCMLYVAGKIKTTRIIMPTEATVSRISGSHGSS